MKQQTSRFFGFCLLVMSFLVSCGPSQKELDLVAREQALVVKDSLIRQDSILIMGILTQHQESLCDTMSAELKLKKEKLLQFTYELNSWKSDAEYEITEQKNDRNYKAGQRRDTYPYYEQLTIANTAAIRNWLKMDTAQFLKYAVACLIQEHYGDWDQGYRTKDTMDRAKPGTMGIVFQEVDRLNQLDKAFKAKAEIVYKAEVQKNEALAAGEFKKIAAVYAAKLKAKVEELGL